MEAINTVCMEIEPVHPLLKNVPPAVRNPVRTEYGHLLYVLLSSSVPIPNYVHQKILCRDPAGIQECLIE